MRFQLHSNLPDDQYFGGYTIKELKSIYNSDGLESVQNLLKNKSIYVTQNIKVHYNINGEIIGMDASYLVNGTSHIKPSESTFKTIIGDIRQFTPDAEMSLKYEGYDNLKLIDKIQAKKGELEFRRLDLIVDDTVVADDVLARYLSASGKKLNELSAIDNKLLKVAQKLTFEGRGILLLQCYKNENKSRSDIVIFRCDITLFFFLCLNFAFRAKMLDLFCRVW